jgi:transcriptional regulator with XRE-family HTH domain
MDNKLVGQNIRKYRRFRDMSQKELAKAVGYATKSSINKIEAGDASVPIPRLTQIANALRVPLQALMENIPDDGMPYEDYSTTEVASTNQSNELEFVVQNRIEYMEIGELKNHIDSEMDKMEQSYKFLATFVEKAEAEIKTLKKHNPHDYLIESVELLGSDEKINYTRDEKALTIKVKGEIKNDLPICFKIAIG